MVHPVCFLAQTEVLFHFVTKSTKRCDDEGECCQGIAWFRFPHLRIQLLLPLQQKHTHTISLKLKTTCCVKHI